MPDSPTTGPRPIRRVLISVSDKSGIVQFARALAAQGVALISTGNSARTLAEAGLPVTEVAAVTGSPEMLDGRVKTLHPAIHGGLLARRDRLDHLATLAEHGIGEIPHQKAAFYRNEEQRFGVATARQLQGKELSYNNYADTDAAFELVAEFAEPAVAIIKHANPCGVALGAGLRAAWDRALACDPVSAFGGIVAVNRPLDAATAAAIAEIFVEVIIAPEAEPTACEVLAKKRLVRLLLTGGMPDPNAPGCRGHS